MTPTLYERATSSCSFRIRIALNLSGIAYEHAYVSTDQGKGAEYKKKNPQGLVPLLVNGQDQIAQSIAIFEYIIEEFGGHSLLPEDAAGRARARSIAQYIVSEIQPFQNTRIDAFLAEQGIEELVWKRHWIKAGLRDVEVMLASPSTELIHSGSFCHGDSPTIADCCLIPQVYNAVVRYKIALDEYPKVEKIYQEAQKLTAFKKAWPEAQPDFQQPQ